MRDVAKAHKLVGEKNTPELSAATLSNVTTVVTLNVDLLCNGALTTIRSIEHPAGNIKYSTNNKRQR